MLLGPFGGVRRSVSPRGRAEGGPTFPPGRSISCPFAAAATSRRGLIGEDDEDWGVRWSKTAGATHHAPGVRAAAPTATRSSCHRLDADHEPILYRGPSLHPSTLPPITRRQIHVASRSRPRPDPQRMELITRASGAGKLNYGSGTITCKLMGALFHKRRLDISTSRSRKPERQGLLTGASISSTPPCGRPLMRAPAAARQARQPPTPLSRSSPLADAAGLRISTCIVWLGWCAERQPKLIVERSTECAHPGPTQRAQTFQSSGLRGEQHAGGIRAFIRRNRRWSKSWRPRLKYDEYYEAHDSRYTRPCRGHQYDPPYRTGSPAAERACRQQKSWRLSEARPDQRISRARSWPQLMRSP